MDGGLIQEVSVDIDHEVGRVGGKYLDSTV
jgi:hypothetical protein